LRGAYSHYFHRPCDHADFSGFASHAKIAEHAFFACALAEFAGFMLKWPGMVKLRDNPGDAKPERAERLASVDALRGLLLLLFISGGFGLKEMLTDERWKWLARQWSPSGWEGCTLWDLLCPGMLFIVGIAMPHSYANRQAMGQNWARQFLHALCRAAILVALGIYLDSYFARPEPKLVLDLHGDLQQLGVAYLLAFLLLPLGMSVHGLGAAFLLIGVTAAYVIFALAGGHEIWASEQNVGIALDRWLQMLPRDHLVTLNVVSATAIVLLGNLIGGLVRSGAASGAKVAIMTGVSILAILFGWTLSGGGGLIDLKWFAVIPMHRPILTATFVFASVGWVLLAFTYIYLVTDGFAWRAWAMPLALLGRNALVLYLAYVLAHGWAETSAKLVLPNAPPMAATLRPLFVSLIVMAIYWLLCFWLYRRRIFIKV
jgi:predicted acyltransferase